MAWNQNACEAFGRTAHTPPLTATKVPAATAAARKRRVRSR